MAQAKHGWKIRQSDSVVNGKSYVRYILDLGRDSDGKRVRKSFPTLDAAEQEARKQERLNKRIGRKAKGLSDAQLSEASAAFSAVDEMGLSLTMAISELSRARRAAACHGVTLPEALAEFAECMVNMKGRGAPSEAVKFFIDHSPDPDGNGRGKSRTVSELCERHIEAKRKAGRRPATIIDLNLRLGRLTKHLGDRLVSTVTADDLQAALDHYGDDQPATRNTYIRVWGAVFRRAARDGICDHNPVERLEKSTTDENDIDTFDSTETRNVMVAAAAYDAQHSRQTLPYFALGLFAGLRPQEICRLEWSDIKWNRSLIRVSGKQTKTHRRRNVTIEPNLLAWLAPYRLNKGLIVESSKHTDAARAVIKEKVRWGHDLMRHTYGTMHYARYENIGKTSKQMGNTIAVAQRHYCDGEITAEDAKPFWEIRPPSESNVVAMSA